MAPTTPSRRFNKSEKLYSYKHQHAIAYEAAQVAEEDKYLTDQPPRQDGITKIWQVSTTPHLGPLTNLQGRIVVPLHDNLPPNIGDIPGIDNIRRKGVYITRAKPNVIDIRGYSKPLFMNAFQSINWVLRDMRLSSDRLLTRFYVQPQVHGGNSPVNMPLGGRPAVASPVNSLVDTEITDISTALACHTAKFAARLEAAAESLMSIGKELALRVDFGQLEIRQKRKGGKDEISYDELEKVLAEYSRRGGASLNSRLEDVADAQKFASIVGKNAVKKAMVKFYTRDGEVSCDVDDSNGLAVPASIVRAEEPPRLDWIVSAPDM